MLYLSRKDIEEISKPIIADYMRLPRFGGRRISRIDPLILAKELVGLRVGHYHLSRSRTILGLTTYSQVNVKVYNESDEAVLLPLNRGTILIEEDLLATDQRGRRNFTIMHETAHQLFGSMYPNEYLSMRGPVHSYRECDTRNTPARNWNEWQADAMASCLLLPAELVRESMERVGLGDKLDVLNKVYRPKEYERFEQMAYQMGASKTALAIRMKQLGLLGEDFRADPYALVDIYPEDN